MNDPRQQEGAIGATLAFAVGDALGWPLEIRGNRVGGMKDLKPELTLRPWIRREGGRHAPHEEQMPAGVYSDDTQLMVAVARSLHRREWWEHLTRVELPWWAHYELGGGGATRRAAQAWAKGEAPWEPAGAKGYWEAGGNGAAMRVLAHCVVEGEPFSKVRTRVLCDGAATHGDPAALVGAQAYAYALWTTLRRRQPLGWGELLDEVSGSVDEWARLDPEAVPLDWARWLPDNYSERWARTVDELTERLTYARKQLAHGALAVDDSVLRELGCFSRQSGAGTVTAAGALYLASRHAAEPVQGLLRAAFARGADTDTLAAMTGALLGAVHGPGWLGNAASRVMDSELLRRTAEHFGRNQEESEPRHSPSAQRMVEEKLARAMPGVQAHLPFYGDVSVTEVRDLDNRLSRIRSWWMVNAEGQTFRVKRISRANSAPWAPLTAPTGSDGMPEWPSGHVRAGLVIRVADVAQTRDFYETVLGLPVTRQTKFAIVLAGWLALEAASDTQADAQARFPLGDHLGFAVALYADEDRFSDLCERLKHSNVRFTLEETDRGPLVCTADPDGIPVEIRLARS